MKLIKLAALVASFLAAQIVLRQYSSQHQIGVELADIDRQLLRNPPEREQLLIRKAKLLEDTGHLENALRTYGTVSTIRPEQLAGLRQKIQQQQQLLAQGRKVPRLFAVLIGISAYEQASLPRLSTAEADASAFAGFLGSDRRSGPNPQLFALIGANAREAAVRSALQTVLRSQAGSDDTVYVYISAHGLTEPPPNRRAFLMAADTNPWEKTAAGYAFSTLRELLEKNPARPRNVLMIADLCQTPNFQGRVNDVNSILEQQLGKTNPFVQVFLAGCPEPGAAKSGSQLGFFTHHLDQGLQGPADRNGDRTITSNELFTYVREQTGVGSRWRSEAVRFGASLDIPMAQLKRVATDQEQHSPWLRVFVSPWAQSAHYAPFAGRSLFLAYAQPAPAQDQPTLAQQTFGDNSTAFDLAVAAEDLGQQVILKYLLGEDSPQSQSDFDRGAEFFRLANDLNPSPHLRGREAFCLGRSLVFQRRFPEAMSQLEQTIRTEPDAAYAYNALGIAYLEQGRFSEARSRFSEAISNAPTWPYPRNNLALTLTELGQYREAETEYRAAIARAPGSAYLRYNLGVLLHRRNRLDEARRIYDELIAQQPAIAPPYIGRGALLASAGNFKEAVQEYEKALGIDSSSAAARHSLGLAYSHQGERDRALQSWSENISVNPAFMPSRVCIAESHERREEWQEAAKQYAAILQRDSGQVAARISLADALRRAGKPDEAEKELRSAMSQAPNYWLIRERLGDLLNIRGSVEAREQYRIARDKAFEKSDKKRLKAKAEGRGTPGSFTTTEQTKKSCFP